MVVALQSNCIFNKKKYLHFVDCFPVEWHTFPWIYACACFISCFELSRLRQLFYSKVKKYILRFDWIQNDSFHCDWLVKCFWNWTVSSFSDSHIIIIVIVIIIEVLYMESEMSFALQITIQFDRFFFRAQKPSSTTISTLNFLSFATFTYLYI